MTGRSTAAKRVGPVPLWHRPPQLLRQAASEAGRPSHDTGLHGRASRCPKGTRVAFALLLMDLRMPEVDGVGATARIRARHPDANILVLTTYDTDADILKVIEAGATGYLLKGKHDAIEVQLTDDHPR